MPAQANKTKVEWTDLTQNTVTGCDPVSPGCDRCYARTFAERFRGVPGNHFEHGFDLQLRPERLDIPLRTKKPSKFFVNSMSDWLHKDIPDDYILQMFDVDGQSRLAHLPIADEAAIPTRQHIAPRNDT